MTEAPHISALDHLAQDAGSPRLVCLPIQRGPLVVLKWKIPLFRSMGSVKQLSDLETALGRLWLEMSHENRSSLLGRSGARLSFTASFQGMAVSAKFLNCGTLEVVRMLCQVLTAELPYVMSTTSRTASHSDNLIGRAREAALTIMVANSNFRASQDDVTSMQRLHDVLDLARSSIMLVGPVHYQAVRTVLDDELSISCHKFDMPPSVDSLRPAPGVFEFSSPSRGNELVMLAAPAPARGDPNLPAAEVATALFGGWHGSRLFRHLRDRCGLTYGPFCRIEHHAEGALFMAAVPVKPGNNTIVLHEVCSVVDQTINYPPGSVEVAAGVRFVAGTLVISLDTLTGLASCLASLEPRPGPSFVNDQLTALYAVTAADVARTNERLLGAHNVSVVLFESECTKNRQLDTRG
jgi:hypothetical protein